MLRVTPLLCLSILLNKSVSILSPSKKRILRHTSTYLLKRPIYIYIYSSLVYCTTFYFQILRVHQATLRRMWKPRTEMCSRCTFFRCHLPRRLQQLCQVPWQKGRALTRTPSIRSPTPYHTVFPRTGSGARKAFSRSSVLLMLQV